MGKEDQDSHLSDSGILQTGCELMQRGKTMKARICQGNKKEGHTPAIMFILKEERETGIQNLVS
jgi:hypothetical protein